MIDEATIHEFLRINGKGNLYHREGQELEFKEQFNLAGLADYFRDFAAFANNRGGYLVFGVTDTPRTLKGLSAKSLQQFETIDPERITGFLLDYFSGEIIWEQSIIEYNGMSFGVFKIHPAVVKPIIAKKDDNKATIKSGDVYYRYGGRTQRILATELEAIINKRIETNNKQWMDSVSKIGKAGPSNVAILDTEKAIIEKGNANILVVDEKLANQLKFIKEGEFVEKNGSSTLKLVGEVVPIDTVEVVKHVKESLTKQYPFSALELMEEVKKRVSGCNQNQVWEVTKNNGIKGNSDYSAYNFRNKKQEDEYIKSGRVPKGTPCIFNEKAIDLVVKILQQG